MVTSKKIKALYTLTEREEKILGDLNPAMRKHRDRFGEELLDFMMANDEMAPFFPTDDKVKHHSHVFAGWFMRLFTGKYDEAYFRRLQNVGRIHVNISLDGHLVNATMARVRQFAAEAVEMEVAEGDREETMAAVNKILDINLDVLTSSYRQAELKKYFLHARAEIALIGGLERFTHGLNLVLGVALGIVSLAVVGLFIHDIVSIFNFENLEKSVIAALGSLLIIWMMIELLSTEIAHLKGRKIPIKLFIGIVIVAFIRKVLIGSLEHATIQEYGTRVLTLFILALVYWLIAKADRE